MIIWLFSLILNTELYRVILSLVLCGNVQTFQWMCFVFYILYKSLILVKAAMVKNERLNWIKFCFEFLQLACFLKRNFSIVTLWHRSFTIFTAISPAVFSYLGQQLKHFELDIFSKQTCLHYPHSPPQCINNFYCYQQAAFMLNNQWYDKTDILLKATLSFPVDEKSECFSTKGRFIRDNLYNSACYNGE